MKKFWKTVYGPLLHDAFRKITIQLLGQQCAS